MVVTVQDEGGRGRQLAAALAIVLLTYAIALRVIWFVRTGSLAFPEVVAGPIVLGGLGYLTYRGLGWARWSLVIILALLAIRWMVPSTSGGFEQFYPWWFVVANALFCGGTAGAMTISRSLRQLAVARKQRFGNRTSWFSHGDPTALVKKRPLLLTVLMGLLFAAAGYLVVSMVYTLVRPGPFLHDGQAVSRGTYFVYNLPIVFVMGGAVLVPGLALLRRRWWAQHAVAAFCLLVVVSSTVSDSALTYTPRKLAELLLAWAPFLALCFWYLYAKKRVKAYFAGLRQRDESDGALNA
jgi:hypothetical protein